MLRPEDRLKVPAVQAEQVAELDWPGFEEVVPAGQEVQLACSAALSLA